mgnify:CR=1 FL=1
MLLLLLWSWTCLQGQDTITVMQYNLLYYGNYNSAFAGCNEATNNTQDKDENIRTLLDYVKPDILTVNEFGATQTILDNFVRHNLNINGAEYWKTDNIVNYANSSIVNHIFYDSRKMELKRHAVIRTAVRDIDAYELYFKTSGLAAGDTVKLVCMVAHLKAGNNSTDEGKRRAMIQNAMDFIDENYPNDNVLIMGDFNMYSSTESAYRLLTQSYSNNDILFVDPLSLVGGVGNWHNKYQYAQFHTQSTMGWSDNDCRSGGGLDDRFDMILMSDEIYMGFNDLRYVTQSYHAVGNDGNHFNQSINEGANLAVPELVAEALYACSDHLPVTMKMRLHAQLSVDEQPFAALQASVSPNPATNQIKLHFFNPSESSLRVELLTLQGQVLAVEEFQAEEGTQQWEGSVQDLTPGFYLIRLSNSEGWAQTMKMVKR